MIDIQTAAVLAQLSGYSENPSDWRLPPAIRLVCWILSAAVKHLGHYLTVGGMVRKDPIKLQEWRVYA